MPRVVESTVYQFDELTDRAKEKARDWFREGIAGDNMDHVTAAAVECAKILGIEIDHSDARNEPKIYWSGFSSQGDGACFEGSYSYAKGAAKKIRKHAPANPAGGAGPRDLNAMLHRIADDLEAAQRKAKWRLVATCTHSGRYYHSGCMRVIEAEVDGGRYTAVESVLEGEIIIALRRFADWIYRSLEAEYEFRMSAENVDESIRANEYEFNADGSRASV